MNICLSSDQDLFFKEMIRQSENPVQLSDLLMVSSLILSNKLLSADRVLLFKFLYRQRFREIVTLEVAAAHLRKIGELFSGLYAFGYDIHIQRICQFDDRIEDDPAAFAVADLPEEAHIDL